MTWLWPSLLGLSRVVQPDTILRWHRAGFRAYWRWKSRGRAGRPRVSRELRALIRRMSKENPLWGAPRIHGELLKLGFEIAESSVSKYMIRRRGPPSQTWRTFLRSHAEGIAAIDLCVVPTATFERLFAFLVVGHGRRELLWFAVTRNPTAEWLAQQIVEAFPWNTAPTYLVRDNDGAYGHAFTSRVRAMGIRDRPIAPRSPWQNPYAERLIGTLRRDCLDHILIFGERHLHRVLTLYSLYYNETRTHLGLSKDVPLGRAIPAIGDRHRHASSIWIASSLRADMIFGKDTYTKCPDTHPKQGRLGSKSMAALHRRERAQRRRARATKPRVRLRLRGLCSAGCKNRVFIVSCDGARRLCVLFSDSTLPCSSRLQPSDRTVRS
jgi:transposase InsO family protein